MLTKTIHTLGFVPSSAKIISIMFYVYSSNTFNKNYDLFFKERNEAVSNNYTFSWHFYTE